MLAHGITDDGLCWTPVAKVLSRDNDVIMSMRAITSLVLAGLFPDLPRAILLEDPPPFWMSSASNIRSNEVVTGLIGWIYSNKRKTHDDLLAECRMNSPTWPDVELDPWVNPNEILAAMDM